MQATEEAVAKWVELSFTDNKNILPTIHELTVHEALTVQAHAMCWYVDKHFADDGVPDALDDGMRYAFGVVQEADALKARMGAEFDVKFIARAFRTFWFGDPVMDCWIWH